MTAGAPIAGEAVSVGEAGPSGANHHPGDTPQTIVAPPRFVPSGPLHTIIIVDLPPISDIVKNLQESMAHMTGDGMMRPPPPPARGGDSINMNMNRRDGPSDSGSTSDGGGGGGPNDEIPGPENGGPMPGQALPLLFIRGSDGMGYHSGRSIACDHIYPEVSIEGMHGRAGADGRSAADGTWLSGNTGGWQLRVL